MWHNRACSANDCKSSTSYVICGGRHNFLATSRNSRADHWFVEIRNPRFLTFWLNANFLLQPPPYTGKNSPAKFISSFRCIISFFQTLNCINTVASSVQGCNSLLRLQMLMLQKRISLLSKLVSLCRFAFSNCELLIILKVNFRKKE